MEDRLVAESRVQATALAGYAAVVTDAAAARALAASLFDSPQVVAAWIDAALCYRCVSRGYASLDDREPAEYPGRRVFELHPDTVMEERFAQVLTTGEPQAGSATPCATVAKGSRGITWWDWSLTPLRDPQGKVDGLLLVLVDVSARIEAEATLAARERIATAALSVMTDLFVVVDMRGRVLLHNPALLSITGLNAEDLRARPLWEYAPEADRPRLAADLAPLIAEGRTVTQEILVPRRAGNGTPVPLEVKATRVDLAPDTPAVVAVGRDLRPWRALQERLKEAERLESVGRLASGVAHDFNNILDVVVNNCDELLGRNGHDEESVMRLREIQDVGFRATALTRQLLAFARRQALTQERIDIGLIVRDSERILRRMLGRSMALQIRVEPDLPRVLADRSQVEQVLYNLVANARDAIDDSGTVTIEVRSALISASDLVRDYLGQAELPDGAYVRLTVSDDGAGMDPQILAHVFEPYFTTRQAEGGTGLGLSTVYGIVSQSRGYISVHSMPGRGTTFDILLPRDAPGRNTVEASHESEEGRTLQLLVVEDDPVIREGMVRRLRREGYLVHTADNGRRARAMVESAEAVPDVLITDVRLPDCNGRELARELRLVLSGLGVVYVSGYLAEAVLGYGVEEPRTKFLEKPVSTPRLLHAIAAVGRRDAVDGP